MNTLNRRAAGAGSERRGMRQWGVPLDPKRLLSAPFPLQGSPAILFIIASLVTPLSGEAHFRTWLLARGAGSVDFTLANDISLATKLLACDLCIVSDSVTAGVLGTALNLLAKPCVIASGGVWDLMNLCDTIGSSSELSLQVTAESHPICQRAHLDNGLKTFAGAGVTIGNGVTLGAGGTAVCHREGQPTQHVLFTYAAGATLFGGGTAPARRVCCPGGSTWTEGCNVNGLALLDACVDWALGAI